MSEHPQTSEHPPESHEAQRSRRRTKALRRVVILRDSLADDGAELMALEGTASMNGTPQSGDERAGVLRDRLECRGRELDVRRDEYAALQGREGRDER
jgi:hypothetical protein